MSSTVANPVGRRHLVFFQDGLKRMAKAGLDFLQDRAERAAFGSTLHRVPRLLNLSDKEFADRLGVSQQQLGNWHAGQENAALWRYQRDPDVFDALMRAMVERNPRVIATTSFAFQERKLG